MTSPDFPRLHPHHSPANAGESPDHASAADPNAFIAALNRIGKGAAADGQPWPERHQMPGRRMALADADCALAGLRVALEMMLAAERVRWPYLELLAGEGDLTLQQYNVLRILRGAGASGLPTLDIVERMVEEAPGITRLIDRLESKKLVVRKRCKTDRRQVFCCITERGLALLDGLDEPLHAAEKAALGALSEKQLGQLLSLLDKARTGLNAALVARRSDPIQEDL